MKEFEKHVHDENCEHDHDAPQYVTLIDEHGEERNFEIVEMFELEDEEFAILVDTDGGEEEAFIFRMVETGEELQFTSLEDDEFARIRDAYYEMLDEEEQ